MTRSALKCNICNQSVTNTLKHTKGLNPLVTRLHWLHLFLKNFYKQKNMTETICKVHPIKIKDYLIDLLFPNHYLYICNSKY